MPYFLSLSDSRVKCLMPSCKWWSDDSTILLIWRRRLLNAEMMLRLHKLKCLSPSLLLSIQDSCVICKFQQKPPPWTCQTVNNFPLLNKLSSGSSRVCKLSTFHESWHKSQCKFLKVLTIFPTADSPWGKIHQENILTEKVVERHYF